MSLKKFERMWNQFDDNFERLYRPARTSRQIQDQSPAVHSTYPAAQGSKRSFLHSFTTHAFGHAIEHAVTNRPRCLRHVKAPSHVAVHPRAGGVVAR